MSLLHCGTHLAVPYTHWCLWEVMTQLVKSSCQKDTNLLHPVGGGEGPAQFIRLLSLLLWSPMGATLFQAFLGYPFTTSLHY